jgi:phage recombination protein Bet
MSNIVIAEAGKLAKRFQIDASPAEIVETLKATAFKGQVTDAQMAALMLVSAQYGLNPWTKEIYAFPDKNNGIVPVVGVDGWARIINEHPQFDGMEFEQDDESCTCIIYRKDRSHPIKVTEYMAECKRQTGPWQSHPRRMLRHKAMIQCARLAFGYGGIYDQDEAERIVEAIDAETGEIRQAKPARPALEPYPADKFDANLPAWRALIESGRKTADDIIAMVTSRATLTDAQIKAIRNCAAVDVDASEVTE